MERPGFGLVYKLKQVVRESDPMSRLRFVLSSCPPGGRLRKLRFSLLRSRRVPPGFLRLNFSSNHLDSFISLVVVELLSKLACDLVILILKICNSIAHALLRFPTFRAWFSRIKPRMLN